MLTESTLDELERLSREALDDRCNIVVRDGAVSRYRDWQLAQWSLRIKCGPSEVLALIAEVRAGKERLKFLCESKCWVVPQSYGWVLRTEQGHNVEFEFERSHEHNGFPGAFADPFAAIDAYREWKAARAAKERPQ